MTSEGTSESDLKTHTQKNRLVENQLVIKLKKQFAVNPAARKQVIDSLPDESTIDRDFDELGVALINLPEGANPSEVAQKLGNQQAIEYAEPNFIDSGTVR